LWLQALEPDVFLFENVAHFASALKTPGGSIDAAALLQDAINDLSDHDIQYEVSADIIRAREHSVPQDRERFVMIGVRQEVGAETTGVPHSLLQLSAQDDEVPLTVALQGLSRPGLFSHAGSRLGAATTAFRTSCFTLTDRRLPRSHRTFIEWIRQSDPSGRQPATCDAHIVRAARDDDLALIEKLAPGQRWMDYKLKHSQTLGQLEDLVRAVREVVEREDVAGLPTAAAVSELADRVNDSLLLRLLLEEVSSDLDDEHHLLGAGYLRKGDDSHGDWLERLKPGRPCKTIVAHIGKDTYGYIHPFEDRAISIREAGRVQTFPDWFSFGSVGVVDGYSMIGNAVPPLLAAQLASRIAEFITSKTQFPIPPAGRAEALLTEFDAKTLFDESQNATQLVKEGLTARVE
jgi:site-specific DNA-cytosine methylase